MGKIQIESCATPLISWFKIISADDLLHSERPFLISLINRWPVYFTSYRTFGHFMCSRSPSCLFRSFLPLVHHGFFAIWQFYNHFIWPSCQVVHGTERAILSTHHYACIQERYATNDLVNRTRKKATGNKAEKAIGVHGLIVACALSLYSKSADEPHVCACVSTATRLMPIWIRCDREAELTGRVNRY